MATKNEKRRLFIYINGEEVKNNLRSLTSESRKLRNEIAGLTPGTKEFINSSRKLQQVNARIKDIRNQANGLSGTFSKLKGFMSSGLGIALGIAAVVQGIRKVAEFGVESVNAYREQVKVLAGVKQAIKSTGGAANLSLRELTTTAENLQKKTLFGDEEILKGVTAQLLTFTNIAGDEFLRTQKVALDLSTVLGTDLKANSIQLGKALNDPVKNLSALSRSGIQFSKDQENTIKKLANTNQLAQAQALILAELETQYGGQAEAAAKADGGYTQLSNTYGDLKEKIGGLVNEGSSGFIPFLNRVVDFFSRMLDNTKPFADAFDSIGIVLSGLGAAFSNLVGNIGSLNGVTDKSVVVMNVLGKAFNLGLTPIKILISSVTALINGFSLLIETGKKVANFFGADFQNVDVEGAANRLKDGVVSSAKELKNSVVSIFESTEKEKTNIQEKQTEERKKKIQEESIEQRKQRKKFIKEEEKLQSKITEIRNKIAESKLEKDEAEILKIKNKYAKLFEEAKGHQDRLKELELLRDEEIAIKEAAQEEKRLEKEAKLLEEKQTFEEQLHLLQLQGIDKELASEDAKYRSLYEKADKFGLDTAMLESMHASSRLSIIKKHKQKEAEEVEKSEAAKRAAQLDTFDLVSGLLSNMVALSGVSANDMKNINTITALADTYTSANRAYLSQLIPGDPTSPIRASLAAATAITSGLINVKNIQGLAEGGFTGPGFGKPDNSGFKVAGYVHENEWVAPEWMTESPLYADTIKMLEYARKSKSGYSEGGNVSRTETTEPPIPDNSESIELMNSINTLNTILSGGIKAVSVIDQNGLINIQEGLNEINEINNN